MAGSWRCVISDRFEIYGKPPPSHSAARPLRGWGLAVLGRNTPCLRMSVLRPQTAKPPLVRHAVWTRDRHDFGTLEIRICVCSVEENSHESWSLLLGFSGVPSTARKPPLCHFYRHSRARPWTAALPTPRGRGQRRLVGRRSAAAHRLPANSPFGPDAALTGLCPKERYPHTEAEAAPECVRATVARLCCPFFLQNLSNVGRPTALHRAMLGSGAAAEPVGAGPVGLGRP